MEGTTKPREQNEQSFCEHCIIPWRVQILVPSSHPSHDVFHKMGMEISSSARQDTPQKCSKILEEAFDSVNKYTVHLKLTYVALSLGKALREMGRPISLSCFSFSSTHACLDFLIRRQTSQGQTIFCSFL